MHFDVLPLRVLITDCRLPIPDSKCPDQKRVGATPEHGLYGLAIGSACCETVPGKRIRQYRPVPSSHPCDPLFPAALQA